MSSTKSPLQTVSIDFGTSHSGYAWASKELGSQNMQPGQVMSFLNAKQTWPDATGGTFYPKTRSCMMYDTASSRVLAWGNTAAKQALDLVAADMATKLYVDRVKLLLDEKWAESDAGKNLMARLGKTPPQAIAEYLVALANVLATDLEAQDGRKVNFHQLRWVLTVPAMWSPRAKSLMRKAMFLAKLIATEDSDNLMLCLEPEAALLSVAFTSHDIVVGDNILVLDCGGGTIDLSAFNMQPNTGGKTANPFIFQELTRGRGVVKGSVVLDMEFEDFLRSVIGEREWEVIRGDSGVWAKILDSWESIKTRYEGGDMNPAEVTLPRSVFVSLKKAGFPKVKDTLLDFNAAMLAIDDCDIDNAVVLTANTIRRLFDKVLMDILAVTADMMRDCATEGATKRISKVVCVGGFCNNKYLVRSVRAMIDAKFPGVQVVVPANPGSAVLYGAALYGTSPSVVASRVLRYTYGFAATIVVDAETRFQGMDMSDWPIIVDEDMDRVIRGGFSRIAKKGQSMDANEVASIGVGASSANQTGVAIRVFLSDNENPVFVSEAGCKLLGVIEFDAPPRDSEGKMRLVVEFKFGSSEIAVTVKSRDGDFSRTAAISYE